MTEDEVLAQLRDIHVPAELVQGAPMGFAVWPVIALAVAVGIILAVRYWHRNQWRRRACTELSRINRVEDAAAQWSMLLALTSGLSHRAGRQVNVPDLAYRSPASISDAERAAFIAFLSAEFRR